MRASRGSVAGFMGTPAITLRRATTPSATGDRFERRDQPAVGGVEHRDPNGVELGLHREQKRLLHQLPGNELGNRLDVLGIDGHERGIDDSGSRVLLDHRAQDVGRRQLELEEGPQKAHRAGLVKRAGALYEWRLDVAVVDQPVGYRLLAAGAGSSGG